MPARFLILCCLAVAMSWSPLRAQDTEQELVEQTVEWIAHGENWIKRSTLMVWTTISYHLGSQESEAQWAIQPAGFHPLFSQVHVPPDGSYLIHVHSDFQVKAITSRAVDIYHPSGLAISLPASRFLDELHTTDPWQPGLPRKRWLREANFDSTGRFVVTSISEKRVALDVAGMLAAIPPLVKKQ